MKKFVISMVVIILLGAILTGVGCAVYFSGDNKFFSEELEYTEQIYTSDTSFDIINLDLYEPHRIVFKNGDEYSVKYYTNKLSSVDVNAQNGTLSFTERSQSWKNWWQRLKYKFSTTDIEITVPEGVELSLKGSIAGAVKIELPAWKLGTIDLRLSGASEIVGNNVVTENIKLSISGASIMKFNGEFKEINLHTSGSSNLSLSGSATNLYTHTSGNLTLNATALNCPSVSLDTSGYVNATLSGTGNSLNAHTSGAGNIKARDFALETASLDTSGSIDAEVNVSNMLSIKASGRASVNYLGNPQINRSGSGSITINKCD